MFFDLSESFDQLRLFDSEAVVLLYQPALGRADAVLPLAQKAAAAGRQGLTSP